MPDIGDERAAFREAVRRAEEAALAGVTPQSVTTTELETPDALPELEGAEPVQASDQPLPAEPAEADTSEQEQEQEQEQEPEVPAAEPSLEELRAQLAAAQARLEEKDSFIGRQSSEVGELRQAVDELKAQVAAASLAPQAAPVPISMDMIAENPGRATMLAWEQKNEQALSVAFDAWKDEDPFAAASWLGDRKMEQQQAAFEQQLGTVRSEVQTLAVPAQEAATHRVWNEAFDLVEAQHPGFRQDVVRLLEETAPKFPAIADAIAKGDAKTKAEGLTLLYGFDAAAKQDPAAVAAQAAEEARAAAESAAAARAQASVVSQETAGLGAAPPELTPEQAEAQAYIDRIKGRPTLQSGWTGRA